MGSIKFIIFAVLIWLIWRMVVNFLAEKKQESGNAEKISKIKMVMCQYCSVHLPQNTALSHDKHWFCNDEHRQLYLNDNKDKAE